MLCKTISNYDQAAIVFTVFFSWYFNCIRGILSSFMSWVFFYQELSRFIRQRAWNKCESKEKPFNMRIYLWFTKIMSYWNSLQNTMSGTFNIVVNKTLEHRNETEKQVCIRKLNFDLFLFYHNKFSTTSIVSVFSSIYWENRL